MVVCPFCQSPRVTITTDAGGITGNLTEYRCDPCDKTWAEVKSRAKPSAMSPTVPTQRGVLRTDRLSDNQPRL